MDSELMPTYYRSALVKYDGYFNTTQYHGELAAGIYLLPLGEKSRKDMEGSLTVPVEGNKIMILVSDELLAHRTNRNRNNEYYHLMQKLSIFCKIYIAAHTGVIRPKQYKYTSTQIEIRNTKTSILANHWVKFSEAYDKHKLLFRLFGISTIENTDYIFNVMNSTVALEGLLLNGEKSENAYKFRVRGAFLLGKTPRTRVKYYEILKLAYEMRSAIAHANDKEKTRIRNKVKSDLKMTLKVFNEQLINLNRALLQQLINNPHIYDNLDEIVLKG